ncbi:Mitochondrial copper homeostasis protein [Basidiobolus ranarum]|uniref:Mitochondrial copper homeostasis protein n=1 Tax=Basidiobolus ranarum TaxID=34480 RepID=A0ABR2W8J1_9FUNG
MSEPTVETQAEPKRARREFDIKEASKFMDPCAEHTKRSYKCLDKNNYDKSKCTQFFDEYKECKRKWLEDRKAERQKRVSGTVLKYL